MAYSSEQYKYLLIQRLRRHMSMNNDADRIYTQNFFGHLFDDSVTVTEEAYDRFMDLMDQEIQFCADNGIYDCSEITDTMIEEHGLLLVEAFAAIGIDLVIAEAYNSGGSQIGGNATFTKPTGEVMVYEVRGGLYANEKNQFQICAIARTEYQYAKASAKYYNFTDRVPPELKDYNPFRSGIDTFWSYNADTATMTITGDGTYTSAPTDPQIGGGPYTSLIVGANVSCIDTGAFSAPSVQSIVLLHAADAPLQIKESLFGSNKDVSTVAVYCDNQAMRSYENTSSYRVMILYSLDEWNGTAPPKRGKYYNGTYLPPFINGIGNKTYAIIGETTDGVYMATVSSTKDKGTVSADTGRVGTTIGSADILGFGGEEVWTYDSKTDNWYWDCLGMTSRAVKILWANYDVLDANGNVVFKASEPTDTI